MGDLATAGAHQRCDVLGPLPPGLVTSAPECRARNADDVQRAALKRARLVGRVKAAQDAVLQEGPPGWESSLSWRSGSSDFLAQIVGEGHRMLHAVPHRGGALAAQAAKHSRSGAGHLGIGLLRHTGLEYPGALQHEAAGLPGEPADHALEPDERRRAVAPRSEEHTSELQSLAYLVCRLLLEKKK